MPDTVLPTHEALLRLCSAAAPMPWYPKEYAEVSGVPRVSLDVLLNELRLAGLLRLSDWQKQMGQGYLLTESGEEILKSPASLVQLRNGVQKPLITNRVEAPIAAVKKKAMTSYDIAETARVAIYEPAPPRVMPVLLGLNVIAFCVSLFVAQQMGVPIGRFIQQGDPVAMHRVGAVSAIDLLHGEWWRLLTCCFLHFGLLHLFMNMFSLYMLGLVESLYGSARYLIVYLAAGIGGSGIAMFWNPTSGGVLAGASCSIWGLLTGLIAWLFINRSYLNPLHVSSMFRSIGLVVVLNICVSFVPGISAAGHFGGGAVGFVVATLLLVERFAPQPRRTVALILLLLLPLLGYKAADYAMENGPGWQRLKAIDAAIAHRLAVKQFEREAAPAVDKVDNAFAALEAIAYAIAAEAPGDRAEDRRRSKLRSDLTAAAQLADAALTRLGDKPSDDERVEAARSAGSKYVRVVNEQVKTIQELIDTGKIWDAQLRRKSTKEIADARSAWLERRNQLQNGEQ